MTQTGSGRTGKTSEWEREKDLETEQDTQRQKHTQTTWTRISEVKRVMDDLLQSDCVIHQFNTNTQL